MKVYPYIERVYLVETLAQTQHSYNDVKHFFSIVRYRQSLLFLSSIDVIKRYIGQVKL